MPAPVLGAHARGEAGRPGFAAPMCQAGGRRLLKMIKEEKLNQGWGALLVTVALALARSGAVHTKEMNKDLWDHKGAHLTQGEAQDRLPGGSGLGLMVEGRQTLARLWVREGRRKGEGFPARGTGVSQSRLPEEMLDGPWPQ